MSDKYTLVGRVPVKCHDLITWAQEFEKGDKRHVAATELPGGVRVSTVFLGIDHSWGEGPPLVFETMIFGGPQDGYQDRYTTWEQAEAGHAKAVSLASEPDKQDETE